MPALMYWDVLTNSYQQVLANQKGDTGPMGPPGPPGTGGPLDNLSDVAAPSSTPVGKVLGTTGVGVWGPIDPPPTGLSQAAADARYVNITGPETLTGNFTVTGSITAGSITTSGPVSVGGPITNVSTPVANTDAANKAYVDSRIWSGTQAAYNAIVTKDPTVLYVIVA